MESGDVKFGVGLGEEMEDLSSINQVELVDGNNYSREEPSPELKDTMSQQNNKVLTNNTKSGTTLNGTSKDIVKGPKSIISPEPGITRIHSTTGISRINSTTAFRINSTTGNGPDIKHGNRWHSIASSRHSRRISNRNSVPDKRGPWTVFSKVITSCFPPFLLRWYGMETKPVQQAWREKMSLVIIIGIMCMMLGFLTFILQSLLCSEVVNGRIRSQQVTNSMVIIHGTIYDIKEFVHPPARMTRIGFSSGFQVDRAPFPDAGRKDLSFLFQSQTRNNPGACKDIITMTSNEDKDRYFPCIPLDDKSPKITIGSTTDSVCHFNIIPKYNKFKKLGDQFFTWEDIAQSKNQLIVYGGNVLDLSRLDYLSGEVKLISEILQLRNSTNIGTDASYYLNNEMPEVGQCLLELIKVGKIDTNTMGCIITQIIQYITLVVIIGVVLAKFIMAVLFGWVVSWRLGALNELTYQDKLKRIDEIEAWLEGSPVLSDSSQFQSTISDNVELDIGFQLHHTIQLVTCYSEGLSSIQTTLDSLANCNYPKKRQLIIVIADGLITGAGNDQTTPDLCLSLMRDFVIPPSLVKPYSYVAIAEGSKRTNMAKVYAGYYNLDSNHPVPMVLVAKCGLPEEANNSKPGNRGKRDSQVLLMSFLQKAMFDDRMTELDYEMFNAIWNVSGVTPDTFESVLMVDADTSVYPDALTRMVACFARDPRVMGLCGETKIANKSQSWVTMIQVFEYYISHHLSKAFESMFGGVTCLPGCFSMYRIKAPKGNQDWVPILCNPDILQEYSENIVTTLHEKNLLLLGEDRYLTTLMLRNFPKRKLIFVPQAVCKTVVPDTFEVLLSQRRRWINSTIHNLLELVITRDLCGTFCFSMQFITAMELIGTVVLPAAICFTYYLIFVSFVAKEPPIIPLTILGLILGLPAILIVMTTRRLSYLMWMVIYLLSLPIWNFVLPMYAFWHFDDFSWGQTRMVLGDNSADHSVSEGKFNADHIIMKRWCEFERDRQLYTTNFLSTLPESTASLSLSQVTSWDPLGYISPMAISKFSSSLTTSRESLKPSLTSSQSSSKLLLPWRSNNSTNSSKNNIAPVIPIFHPNYQPKNPSSSPTLNPLP